MSSNTDVIRAPSCVQDALASSQAFAARYFDERGIKKLKARINFVERCPFSGIDRFDFVNYSIDGQPDLIRTQRRFDNSKADEDAERGVRFINPRGVSAFAFWPSPGAFVKFKLASDKWICEGVAKAYAAEDLGLAVVGILGVENWHVGGSLELLLDIRAGIKAGDTVRIAIDGDWADPSKPGVFAGASKLMQAIRDVGAKPLLVDLRNAGGKGLDDCVKLWSDTGKNPLGELVRLPYLEEIKRPFNLKIPLETARTFVAENHAHGERPTLAFWQDQFYLWRTSHWEPYSSELLRERLYHWIESKGVAPNRHWVGEIREALAAVVLIQQRDAPCWTDGRGPPVKEILPLANGLLHIPTRALHGHTPRFFNLNASQVTFDPDATCPRWQKFLRDVYPGDAGARRLLQEFLGYSLTSRTEQQKALALIGARRSGKGTIGRIARAMVGSANCCSPSIQAAADTFGFESAVGKKLIFISDARIGAKTNSQALVEKILNLTGEDQMDIARKHIKAWTGTLDAKLWILTNQPPAAMDTGGAFASRFLILDHRVSFFGREDHGLEARLLRELSGILNWSIEGLASLDQRERFFQPKSGRELLESWERLSSPMMGFLHDCCVFEAGASVEKEALRAAYVLWCARSGFVAVTSDVHFSRDLISAAHGKVGTGKKSSKKVFKGVKLMVESKY